MGFTAIFFIIMSLLVVSYLIMLFKTKKRMPILLELFYIFIYTSIAIIYLFPKTLVFIERIFGIKSGINFIIYLSIFIAYLLIFKLYNKIEEQRLEITKLVREIAYLKKDDKKK